MDHATQQSIALSGDALGTVLVTEKGVDVCFSYPVLEGTEFQVFLHPASPGGTSTAATDVIRERDRQVAAEGWTQQHDDQHDDGSIACAGMCYAGHAALQLSGKARQDEEPPTPWPWADEWWKPSEPRRSLVKAGALILAEIERLDRAADSTK